MAPVGSDQGWRADQVQHALCLDRGGDDRPDSRRSSVLPEGTWRPIGKLISAHVGDDEDLDIPAGASDVRHDGYYRFKENAHITAFQAHLHNLGKRQCLEAISARTTRSRC